MAGSARSDPRVTDRTFDLGSVLERCAFPPAGTPVDCAVSGGTDSLALLVLAAEAGCNPTAVHVDHGLRRESGAEAEAVKSAAAMFGAGFRSVRVVVEHGSNLEARARAARQRALGPDALMGHTADDQAETVLLNLLRGAGVDGLAGIRPGRTKPLLRLRRADTASVCCSVGLTPVDDASNRDGAFRRNRIRHEVLPLLESVAERDVAGVIARQARLLRDDADFLDELASSLDPTDARALVAAPAPLARRAIRRWLTAAHPPDAATVDRVLSVARGEAIACDVGNGRRVRRSGMRLSLVTA